MQINKYSLYEQSFISTINYTNSFVIPFTSILTSPSGKIFNVNGFYDNNNSWKLRFVPNEVGMWSGITTSTDTNLHNKNINFECISSEQQGFIKKDIKNPYCIKYENGDYFLPIGDIGSGFPMNQTSKQPTSNWKKYFDEMLNTTKTNHLFCYMITNPSWNKNGYCAWAFGGTPESPDFNKYNIEQFQFYDEVINYAYSKGIVISLILLDWTTEPKDYPSNILTTTQKQAFYKYTIARLAHHKNIIWNLYWDISANQQFVKDEGNYIKSIDPYNHLLTSHQKRDTGYSYATENWSDIISLETLDELDGNDIKNWRIYNKPVIISEDRYSWYRWPDNPPYFFRRLLWTSILSGGSSTWGETEGAYTTTADYELYSDPDCNRHGGKRDFKYIHKFFKENNIQFWNMQPHDELVSSGNKCLAKLGNKYIIYLSNPDSGGIYTKDYGCGGSDHNSINSNKIVVPHVIINLSSVSINTTLNVEWYNPRTGIYQGQTTTQGGVQKIFISPSTEDWVLHIYCSTTLCDFTITQ